MSGTAAQSPLTVVGSSIVVIDPTSNAGSTPLLLRNKAAQPVKVFLYAQDFKSKTTDEWLNAKLTFHDASSETGTILYKAATDLPPGETLVLRVEVANIWEAGESAAILLNNGEEIASITAIKYQVPFAVKLDGMSDDKAEVFFQRGVAKQLVLKNDDPMTYPLRWDLSIAGKQLGSRTAWLQPGSAVRIDVMPRNEWFSSWMSGLFKNEEKDGVLMLSFAPPAGVSYRYAPSKIIPIKAHLSYYSPTWHELRVTIFVFVALFLGGGLSVVLNHLMPNKLRLIDLQETLHTIRDRIRSFANRFDSSLRVQLLTEWHRLQALLQSRWALSPEITHVFARVQQRLVLLDKQVTLVEKMHEVADDVRTLRAEDTPPTLIERLEEALDRAADMLKSRDLSDASLQKVQEIVDQVSRRAGAIRELDETFTKELADRVDAVWPLLQPQGTLTSNTHYQRLTPHVPRLTKFFNRDQKPESEYIKKNYWLVDSSTVASSLYVQYLELLEGRVSDAFKDYEEVFLSSVNTLTILGLQSARHLLQQMTQQIYAASLIEAIQQSRFSFVIEPAGPRPYQPVQCCVVFTDSNLNQAAARDAITCQWKFTHAKTSWVQRSAPPSWTENGWEVYHYFPGAGTHTIQVSFKDEKGQPVLPDAQAADTQKTSIIVQPAPRTYFGDRTKIEVLRFGVVLCATLFGLLAGAKEQLQKLDLVAGFFTVFLLGFGADTVKNLLTQRLPPSEPKPE